MHALPGPTNAGGGGPTNVAALASKLCWTCRRKGKIISQTANTK